MLMASHLLFALCSVLYVRVQYYDRMFNMSSLAGRPDLLQDGRSGVRILVCASGFLFS
jgi:hypothetical protein